MLMQDERAYGEVNVQKAYETRIGGMQGMINALDGALKRQEGITRKEALKHGLEKGIMHDRIRMLEGQVYGHRMQRR